VGRRYLDLVERVVWTALQAFAASMLVVGFDDLAQAARISGAAAAVSVLKCVVAMNVGDRDSAAALPGG
jgi:hypothetical protein